MVVEQGHHFARSRDVLAAFLRGLQIHHLAAQASVRKAERIEHGIHVLHADAVDEYVGRGVVADRDHHGRQIAQRDPRDAWCKPVHDVAVGNEVGSLHRVEIGQLQFALLGLQVEIGQHRDLDGTGLGEDFVFVQEKVVAAREVFDGNAHHAVEVLVDP